MMNDISIKNVFNADHVLLDLDAKCQEDVFHAVARMAERDGVATSADALFEGFVEREREVTTGLMDGFAIPHTKSSAATCAAMYYVRLTAPLAWQTMDDQPVRNLFCLIAPAECEGNPHLALLSALATSLLEDEFKQAVDNAATAEELVALVNERGEKEVR